MKLQFGTVIFFIHYMKSMKISSLSIALLMGTLFSSFQVLQADDTFPLQNRLKDKDTTIIAANGTRLFIPSGTFAPYSVKEVYVEVKEYLDRCDLFGMDLRMQSVDGEYLLSDGMLYITARKEGKNVAFQKPIEVWMPTSKTDTTMRVYTTQKMDDGKILWKKVNSSVDYHVNKIRYYSYVISEAGWYNVQKPVEKKEAIRFLVNPKEKRNPKDKYRIKNKSHAHPLLRVVYADVRTYYELPEGQDGSFCMAKYNTPQNTILISKVITPENKTWYFAKRLSEFQYKKGYYIITPEDYIVRRPATPKGNTLSSTNVLPMDDLLKMLCQKMFK